MRFLHLWIPNWPLARRLAAEPALADEPVVVHESHARGGEYVVGCSPLATRLGVQPGMSVAEATAIVGRSRPTQGQRKSHSQALVLLPADPVADRAALVELGHACDRFSPVVAVEEGPTPEGLVFDITGLAPLFGSEQRLAEQIAAAMTERRYPTRLAIADTPAAARAVACYAPHPNSIQIVPPGEVSPALMPLPVAALQLPETVVDLLGQLGIDGIGQLLQLPRHGLQSRFGNQLLRRLDQAFGHTQELLTPLARPATLTAQWNFEIATDHPDTVTAILGALLKRLTHPLASQDHGVTAFSCQFDYEHGPPTVLEVGLYRPTASAEYLLQLLEPHRERNPLTERVAGITVTITATAPMSDRQLQLFDHGRTSDDHPALATLIDRLCGRLGRQAVLRPRLSAETEPELATLFQPLVGTPSPTRRTVQKRPLLKPLERPLRLLPRPLRVEVTSDPQGRPRQFVAHGTLHTIARAWGPERLETGWWRKRTRGIRRDYYRVETTTGSRYWLFEDLKVGSWFVHGEF